MERKVSSELERIMEERKAVILADEAKTIPLHNDEEKESMLARLLHQ